MRITTAFIIAFISLSIISLTSCHKRDPLKDKIKNEAEIMGNSLVSKNYEIFLKYMYPPFLERIGGKGKIISIFEKGLPGGSTIENVKISYPSDTVMINNQIQCTLKEVIEMNVKGGKLISTSTLIGLSEDNGITWYFLDANSRSLETLKTDFPNLSDRLTFEESSKPMFIKE
ncbi:MAG TPA: hypothetical protein VL443_20170 [Cyclobacteriaceae bacterium]|jgi:hypothetical protein|nr:hypothetical protein [Cyclobacteriaceae bacterium]